MSKKYPNKQELIAKGYEVPGAMILEELREQEIINGDLVWSEDTQKYEYDYKLNTNTNG